MNTRDKKVIKVVQNIMSQLRKLSFNEASDAINIANSLLISDGNEKTRAQ